MIKNIKLKVTPEQSRKVQEICFSKGIFWGSGDTVRYTTAPYLYITAGRFLTYGHDYHFFLLIEEKRWTQTFSSKLTVLELENY